MEMKHFKAEAFGDSIFINAVDIEEAKAKLVTMFEADFPHDAVTWTTVTKEEAKDAL